ncbi:hypothetical protein EJ04DRAFT_395206, partial [Polyplosphaeria fusca]
RRPLLPPLLPSPSRSFPHPSTFPLSPDHHLITLIQYNALRGLMTNLVLVLSLSAIPTTCGASDLVPLLPRPASIPSTFAPTALQLRIPHPQWIDTIPCAQLRDNLISTLGQWDEDEICDDVCGGLYEGFDEVEARGLLCWGEPWRVESWEISRGFGGRWGWLLGGCAEMREATVRWRRGRGEE